MESTIKKLFDSAGRKFEIPSYQRAYSWDETQIKQFIEDLKNTRSQYYLGHYLFEKNDGNTLYVIDGQQRLTTCVIFFSVIKKELEDRQKKGEKIELEVDGEMKELEGDKDIAHYYLRDQLKGIQRFKTISDDNNFFIDEIIDNKPNHAAVIDTQSKRRIKEVKAIFEKEFSTETTGDLLRWFELVEKATITQYIVKDKTQATQIFAFQNDRGKDLSKLEIIKTYFMLQIYLSSNNDQKIQDDIKYIEDEISVIYKQIERIDMHEDEVLNYYWRAINGRGLNREDVVKGIKDEIASLKIDKATWIKDFISGLSQAFNTIEQIETSTDSCTQDLLRLKKMALSYPFIIKAYKLNVDEKTILRLIKLLENITFRYLIRGGRAAIESRLNNHLVNFNSAANLNNHIDLIINGLKNDDWWVYWGDKEFTNCLNGLFYQNRVDNYLLWKYELFISNRNYPTPHNISFDDLIKNESIEHIAPQTPTNGNPTANGYGAYVNKANPVEGIVSGEWLNKLGNLMLIAGSDNSSVKNGAFKEKLEIYGKNNLLNQQKEIINFVSDKSNPVWDKDAIEKRQIKIVEAAKEIWNLDYI